MQKECIIYAYTHADADVSRRNLMQLQKCTVRDVSKLALLNKQLIDDEKSNNAMNINELESRMKRFLKTDYSAYFFIE